jgi:AraC-like DNA-binding protein/mannose-6-phosphate isomerase-like protein (cupin superfamily)
VRSRSLPWQDQHSKIDERITSDGVHTWDFESGFPLDVAFFELDHRLQTRLNRHDYFEVVYIERGQVRWTIQDHEFVARAGDSLVIGNYYHRSIAAADARGHRPTARMIALFFHREALGELGRSGDEVELLLPFMVHGARPSHVVPAGTSLSRQVRSSLVDLHARLPARSPRARVAARARLLMLLAGLMEHFDVRDEHLVEARRRRALLDRLRPVFDAVEADIASPPDVAAAARLMGMSLSSFMHFFKDATGQSFVRYVNDFRIARAQLLLARSDRSIAQITDDLGFCDQSYFGLLFRRRFGMTPTQYRKASGQR